MTETNAPVQADSEAQPVADANSIDSIVDAATIAPKDANKPEPSIEPKDQEDDNQDQPWPKKAENALAKEKGKTARLKFERDQERTARQQLEQKLAQYAKPQQKTETVGEPKESDFDNYADYIDARNEFRINKAFAERDGKQQETQQTRQEQEWVNQREQYVAKQIQDFAKSNPEITALVEEFADVVDEFSPQLQRLFLEADNAPMAFYNLAKEGKLESLSSMSLAKAAMEIGRAQTQAPAKPQTKAPAPLPASRGSVAGGKKAEDLSGDEIRSWMKTK